MTRKIAAVIVGILWSSILSSAQSEDLNKRIESMATFRSNSADYKLGSGDLIEIRVFGVPEFDQSQRISAGGTIKLPILDPVVAAGLSAGELERKLTALLDTEVIKNPQVSVFVKEYRSQPVTVLGAVRSPGQFVIQQQLRLADVLSMAGGLQPNADDEAMIQRRSASGEDDIIRINLRELLERGDLTLNAVVQGGDIINIREREAAFVYIVGEVKRPNAYGLTPKQSTRVSEIYAMAGGGTPTAKISDGLLIRYDDAGQQHKIKINFKDILRGKQEDLVVRGRDIIFVPGDLIKSFASNLLSGIPGAVQTIPYRIP
jgi:polysaccharide export outer membrane protein